MDGKTTTIMAAAIVAFVGLIALVCYSSYMHRTLAYENFQATIKDLAPEQKCLHICGFQYPETMYLENYKFCVEKCDRISERQQECGGIQ